MTKGVVENYTIFSDASFDPKLKFGIAGCMIFAGDDIDLPDAQVKTKIIFGNSCSRMEFDSILWALDSIDSLTTVADLKVDLYTDCKGAADFSKRIPKLKELEFKSRKTGELLTNADLYKKLAIWFEKINLNIHWIKGHSPKASRNLQAELFAKLDQEVRHQLRSARHAKL